MEWLAILLMFLIVYGAVRLHDWLELREMRRDFRERFLKRD